MGAVQFIVETASRRHRVRGLADKLAATTANCAHVLGVLRMGVGRAMGGGQSGT